MATDTFEMDPISHKSYTAHVELVRSDTHVDGETMMVSQPQISTWKAIVGNPKIVALCLFANIGGLMYGFDNMVLSLSLSMPAFAQQYGTLQPSGTYIISASWQSLWNAMTQIATALGAASAGLLQDRLGRKLSFIVAAAISMAGVAVLYTSSDPKTYLAGKIVNGLSLGMILTIGQTYISEIALPPFRGIVLSLFTFSTNLGCMIAASLALSRTSVLDRSSYQDLFAGEWCWPGLILLTIFFVPESPYYLVLKGETDKARQQLEKLCGKQEDVESELQRIIDTYEEEQRMHKGSEASSFLDCFRGTDWRRTRIIFYCNGLPQVIGATFMANGPYFLVQAGLSPFRVNMMVELGIGFGIASSLITIYLMNFCGYRRLIMAGVAVSTTLYTVIGIAGCFPGSSSALWVVGIFLQLTWWNFGPTIGPAMAIAGEVSSMRLRSKSLALGFAFNYIFSTIMSVVVPYMFNQDQGDWGGKIGWVYAGMGLIALVLVFLEIPETKARSFPELDSLFLKKVPTRSFKTRIVATHVEQKIVD